MPKLRRVDPEFVPRDQGHVPQVRRETDEKLALPCFEQFDLAARRRLRPGARHHRHGTGIFPYSFAGQQAAVGEAERKTDLNEIEWTYALHEEPATGHDVHHLAIARAEDHRTRQSRCPAACLDNERQRLILQRINPHVIRPKRLLLKSSPQIVHGEWRNFDQVLDRADVARLHAIRAPILPIERHLPGPLHLPKETLVLNFADLLRRPLIRPFEVFVGGREFLPQRIEIERGRIARNFHIGIEFRHRVSAHALDLLERRAFAVPRVPRHVCIPARADLRGAARRSSSADQRGHRRP